MEWNLYDNCIKNRKPIGKFTYKELKEIYPRGKFRRISKKKLVLVNAESNKFQIIESK